MANQQLSGGTQSKVPTFDHILHQCNLSQYLHNMTSENTDPAPPSLPPQMGVSPLIQQVEPVVGHGHHVWPGVVEVLGGSHHQGRLVRHHRRHDRHRHRQEREERRKQHLPSAEREGNV